MMPKVTLAFDTSSAHCAAALLADGDILVTRRDEMARGQAEHLMPMLEEVLRDGGAAWADLDTLGVGIGPGNFTGIRISVAAARGLALGLDVPAIGVSVLEALAFSTDRPVCTTVAAPRGAVYLQVFDHGSPTDPLLTSLDALPDLAQQTTCIGAQADEIAQRSGTRANHPTHPLTVAIARIAAERSQADVPRPAPLYIRAPDAAPSRNAAPVLLR